MNQTFGAFVRQKRMALGISLRGLAARLGLSPVYMSIIETGWQRNCILAKRSGSCFWIWQPRPKK